MNDQQVDNRNTPSYLSHYGMFRAPFMNTVEDDMYYAEPTRTQRLDILLHLAQYGNELLLVTGPEGSGKTTMLHQFMKKVSQDWKVCQINSFNMLTEEQLISRISRGFELPDDNGPLDVMKSNLKRRLDALLVTHQTVVIAMDNAQLLSTATLNLLLEFATIRNISKGIAVRILLFSEPQIKIQLASPELQTRQTLPIRKIDLPPFDEQQTARLIRHRVTTAGLVAKHVFNDAIIGKIFKYSQGWPGLITEIAHQVLFESTPLKRRDVAKKPVSGAESNRSKKPVTIVIGLILAVGLGALLLFQDQINALFKPNSTVSPTNNQSAQKAQQLTIPGQTPSARDTKRVNPALSSPLSTKPHSNINLSKSEDQEFPVIPDANNAAAESPASSRPADSRKKMDNGTEDAAAPVTIPEPQKPASDNTTPATTEINPTESAAARQTPTTRIKSSQPPKTTAPATKTSPPKLATTHTQHPDIPLQHQEGWIMAQPEDGYTLQLVAGYQKTTALNFITSRKLPNTELAYFYSLNRGKAWHTIIFGSYNNRDRAKGAAAELHKHLPHIKPWIRSFKSVQGDIRYAQSRAR